MPWPQLLTAANNFSMEDISIYEMEQDEGAFVEFEQGAFSKLVERIEAREISQSFSAISKFMLSPRHYMAYKLKEFKATKPMVFGDLVDCLLTTPDELEARFMVLPDGASFASHAGLTKYAEFLGISCPETLKVDERKVIVKEKLEALDKRIVTADEKANAERIVKALWANDAAKFILEIGTQTQKDIEFEAFGWNWRGKLDIYGADAGIADVKKVPTARFIDCYRSIEKMHYETQAAIYQKGVGGQLPFYFLCFDATAHCSVIQLSQARIDAAWNKLADTMEAFERCIALNEWNKSYDFWAMSRSGIYQM